MRIHAEKTAERETFAYTYFLDNPQGSVKELNDKLSAKDGRRLNLGRAYAIKAAAAQRLGIPPKVSTKKVKLYPIGTSQSEDTK